MASNERLDQPTVASGSSSSPHNMAAGARVGVARTRAHENDLVTVARLLVLVIEHREPPPA